jgi:MFS family permease
MRKASLGTLFLTVLPGPARLRAGGAVPAGVARSLGASDFVATLLAALVLADAVPVHPAVGAPVRSGGAAAGAAVEHRCLRVGHGLLGFARTLPMLFIARIWSGIATANIAVAQAYIADVTTPETRARGMGIIGMGFGLGFIFGPFVGGELGQLRGDGPDRARWRRFTAAGLSIVNFVLRSSRCRSRCPRARGARPRAAGASSTAGLPRGGPAFPGWAVAIAIGFFVIFWFSGLEVTFSLFTLDAFHMSIAMTGRIFAFVGVVSGDRAGRAHPPAVPPLRRGDAHPRRPVRWRSASPSTRSAPASAPGSSSWPRPHRLRQRPLQPQPLQLHLPPGEPDSQGLTLGVMQSMAALARRDGTADGRLAYETLGMRGPYFLGDGLLFVLRRCSGWWRCPANRRAPRRRGRCARGA